MVLLGLALRHYDDGPQGYPPRSNLKVTHRYLRRSRAVNPISEYSLVDSRLLWSELNLYLYASTYLSYC